MAFADSDLTCDKFLDGQLNILQPRSGYRAGVDPVLLAAAVPAQAGQAVLELGCGAGVASLCLARRVPDLQLFGVELQPHYSDLARRNAAENRLALQVYDADLRALPAALRALSFDQVFANQPYYQRDNGTAATDGGKNTALAGETPLSDWIEAATRRLRPGGRLTVIQQADRLPDLLAAIDRRLGTVLVQPLSPRVGRNAELVILQARKGGRGGFRLAPPLLLHEGARHEVDGESYTAEIRTVLRNGAALAIRP